MANRYRGEIDAEFSHARYRLCLTLGALAEVEPALGAEDLTALAERLGAGRIAARDLRAILAAGLKGGGNPLPEAELDALTHAAGATGLVAVVAELLAATFGGAEP